MINGCSEPTTITFTEGKAAKAKGPTLARSGRIARGELPEQPGPSKGPVARGGATDDPQGFGGLVEREAGEQAELDQLGAAGVDLGKPARCVVEVDQIIERPVTTMPFLPR